MSLCYNIFNKAVQQYITLGVLEVVCSACELQKVYKRHEIISGDVAHQITRWGSLSRTDKDFVPFEADSQPDTINDRWGDRWMLCHCVNGCSETASFPYCLVNLRSTCLSCSLVHIGDAVEARSSAFNSIYLHAHVAITDRH